MSKIINDFSASGEANFVKFEGTEEEAVKFFTDISKKIFEDDAPHIARLNWIVSMAFQWKKTGNIPAAFLLVKSAGNPAPFSTDKSAIGQLKYHHPYKAKDD